MKRLARIALAVALLAASGIAATNAYAARGVSIANFGHSFGAGRYFPPEPTLRHSVLFAAPYGLSERRHARVIPAHPPGNGYKGPPLPAPCPPNQAWDYWPALQGYASWCINRKKDGGLELSAKIVQERMGHSSITVTLDTYGHLFPRTDEGEELAAAERALLG